jgi:hypothetical protein
MTTARPQLYLVLCTCGEKLRVRGGQAGEKLTCKCGATVAVPTVRNLRQLETVDDETAPRPPLAWTTLQGPLFSLGAVALFVGLAMLTYSIVFYTPEADEIAAHFEAHVQHALVPVEKLGIGDLYEEFTELREIGAGSQFDSNFEEARQAAANQRIRRWVSYGLLGIGAAMLLTGLVMSSANAKRR